MLLRLFPALLVAASVALYCMSPSSVAAEPTPYLSAELGLIGAPSAFQRGTERRISTFIRKCAPSVPGCPGTFARSGLYYRLPPGITYVSHATYAPLLPLTCTFDVAPDGSQLIACGGGGLSGGMYNVGSLELRVAVAANAPLGAARLVMAVDDSLPGESTALAECLVDSLPNYCAERTYPIEAAPAADLFIDQMGRHPEVFQPDDLTSKIMVFLGNRGNAPSTGIHVQTHLPPGFQWNPATSSATPMQMDCSKTGSWQTEGEIVTCSGGALAAERYTDLILGIRPRAGMEVPGPLPVVVAVNDGASADPGTLLACADDPSPAHCAWYEVPTWIPCAYERESGIYCDGFDVQAPVGLSPQSVGYER